MTQHTPGPWSYDSYVVLGPEHIVLARVCKEPAEANARLIAAAPELLEALQAINAASRGDLKISVDTAAGILKAIRTTSSAAIAKATDDRP